MTLSVMVVKSATLNVSSPWKSRHPLYWSLLVSPIISSVFFSPRLFAPHQKSAIIAFIYEHHVLGNLKIHIPYVGMVVMTDLMSISLLAWLRVFILHSLSLSRIRAIRYPNTSIYFYPPHTSGRPRYFIGSLVLGICRASSMPFNLSWSAPLLNTRMDLDSFTRWHDILQYFIISSFMWQAFSNDPCINKSESSAKNMWCNSGNPLFKMIPCSCFSLISFSTCLDSKSDNKIKRYGESGFSCLIPLVYRIVEVWYTLTSTR